jgi:putative salt-induced outer membrane protein
MESATQIRIVLTAGVLWLMPICTSAQAPAPAPPPKRETSAEFAFVGTSGNSSTQSIGLGGEFIERPDPWVFTTKTAYVRNKSASELKAESFVLTLQGARTLTLRVSAFGRYGFLHDRFAGIEDRNTLEGGLAYVLVNTAPHKLVVDGGLGYANEHRVVGPDLSTAIAPAGATYTLKISESAEISDDGRFVFSLSQGEDWRLTNIAGITAKITTVFSLKLSNTLRHVNAPTTGFEKTDTITAIALVAKF